MAIIGDPKIIILDEPTTGLDPLTRRQIWEILQHLKKGRSTILTTVGTADDRGTGWKLVAHGGRGVVQERRECCVAQHSMEEADYLCTRIGTAAGRARAGVGDAGW